MAVLDARNSTVDFDMLGLSDTSVGVLNSSSASQASWTSVAGDIIKASGSGFAFSGGIATAGTASAVRLDLGADGSFDVKVTGLALALTGLAASNEQPNLPLFWDRMLGGNDTLWSPLSGENLMFGDGLFTISSSGLPVTGGADTINVGGSAFGTYIGDFLAGTGDGFGGADKLVTTSTLGASLYGDLGHYNGGGTFIGGDDTLIANQVSVLSPSIFNELVGDADTVLGGTFAGGRDIIWGSVAAKDLIVGDANQAAGGNVMGGADIVYARGGNDTVYGDFLTSSAAVTVCGEDQIVGGGGNDILVGDLKEVAGDVGGLTFAFDVLLGGDGNDIIYGDYRVSQVAETQLGGLGGDDDIEGGAGNDILLGQAGDDQIQGGTGDDHLSGGIGADSLWGGKGADHLTGGLNADTFVFTPGDGTDTIYDFTDGQDKLVLTAYGFSGFVDVFAKALMNGNNLEIDFGGGDKLILLGFSITKFDAGDVIL